MEKLRKVLCALWGHSKIQSMCMGYWNCGRCETQIGDSLGGAYPGEDKVIVGHDCETCRTNYAGLGWRDKFLAPDPFEKKR